MVVFPDVPSGARERLQVHGELYRNNGIMAFNLIIVWRSVIDLLLRQSRAINAQLSEIRKNGSGKIFLDLHFIYLRKRYLLSNYEGVSHNAIL